MAQREFNWPSLSVTASSGPVQFNKNGSATTVSQDTVTPANSVPLPIVPLSPDGTPAQGQKVMAQSLSVAIASDQGAINMMNMDSTASGTITSTQTVQISTIGYGTVGFQATGAFTGTIVVESTIDNVNWLTTSYVALTTGNNSSNFSAPTIGQINCAGMLAVRLRGNTVATGTATISMRATSGVSNVMLDNGLPAGSNVIGNVRIDQTTPGTSNAVQVTNLASTLGQKTMANSAAVTIASDQSAIAMTNMTNLPLSGSGSALNANIIGPVDVSAYSMASIQITGTFVATITLQGSNDNTNWNNIVGVITTGATTIASATFTAVGQILLPITTQYIRAQITAYTSGTASITGFASMNPVTDLGTRGVTVNSGTITTVTAANLGTPAPNTDAASGAITTTTTTTPAAISVNVGVSYQVTIPVTVVSGTNPTMDVEIQESTDNGNTWIAIYDFPRITAAGYYTSPVIPYTGNRVREVQTIGGTTPSFTRSIIRNQINGFAPLIRQIIDRTIVLTTLNSTTAIATVDGCDSFNVLVNIGAATTVPVLVLEGSEDQSSWYNLGMAIGVVANTTTSSVLSGPQPKYVRVRVATAGTAVTLNTITIKAAKSTSTTKPNANNNGSTSNTLLSGTTASTIVAPVNAVGFVLEAESTNTNNIRWSAGGTASTTAGVLCEPGRDTGFIPCAANLSVCAVASGTNNVDVQWIISQ